MSLNAASKQIVFENISYSMQYYEVRHATNEKKVGTTPPPTAG